MNVKTLIGNNPFGTASNVYMVIKLYKAGIRPMDSIIEHIHNVDFVGIDDKKFAKALVNKLIDNENKQGQIIEYLLQCFVAGMDEMKTLNSIK